MIVKKEFLERLKRDFNLNIYEVKIWTSLLSRGISNAGELADISGVPRSRCYDVLESLEKKGFIIMKIGKPIKYIAVNPNDIIDRLKKEFLTESEIQIKTIDKVREMEIFRELELLHKVGVEHFNVEDISGSIVGRHNINLDIKNIIRNASKTVTIATTRDGFQRKMKVIKNSLPELKRKNVKITIIAPISERDCNKFNGYAKLINNENSVRFVNVDNEHLLFMINDDNVDFEHDTAVWVKSKFFINYFNKLFEDSLNSR